MARAGDLQTAGEGVRALERFGVHVRRVEQPATEKEAQEILARACSDRHTVLPCGGGTTLGVGALPETVDIALDTTRMDRVLAFDPQNLNLAVLAGMTVEAVNRYLAGQGRGFFLPLDPPRADRATIGGVYASNASGPSRLLYGTVRDQALGVRGADARGREIGFGGKTVKNVSGYDLTKFLAGSAGSLGLITSISFRVMPLPEAASLCRADFGAVEGLAGFLSELRSSVLVPSAVVVTDGAGEDGAVQVLVGFEGHRDAVERQNRDLLRLAGGFGGDGWAAQGREALVEALQAAVDRPDIPEDRISLKACVPIAEGPEAYTRLRKLAEESGAAAQGLSLLAGSGVLFLHAAGLAAEGAVRLAREVKDLARGAGGHAALIRAHRDLQAAWGPRVDEELHRLVLQPIKDRLDPTAVFPPVP